jgi:hypothetical protein
MSGNAADDGSTIWASALIGHDAFRLGVVSFQCMPNFKGRRQRGIHSLKMM